MLLSAQTILGYGQEPSWGTVTNAADWIPVTQLKAMDEVKYKKITNKTRTVGTVKNVPTFAGGKVTASHFATKPSVLDELRAMFGSESVAGTTHTFTLADVPPSYTITEYDGSATRAYAGARLEQWTVSFDVYSGLTCEAQWWSKMSQTIAWPGAAVPTEVPPAVHNGQVSIGGANVGSVESGKWTFTRAIKLLHNNNIQDVVGIQPGPFIAECEIILAIEDESLWTDMQNGTQDSVSTTFDWLTIKVYSANWEEVGMDRGAALLKQRVKLHAVYSDVDDGLVQAIVND